MSRKPTMEMSLNATSLMPLAFVCWAAEVGSDVRSAEPRCRRRFHDGSFDSHRVVPRLQHTQMWRDVTDKVCNIASDVQDSICGMGVGGR